MAKWPYNTTAWRRLRLAKLGLNPLCEACALRERETVAVAVDHITAITKGGDPFPDFDGLMALCHRCHSEKTARVDMGRANSGRRWQGFDANGNPIDPGDAWHTGEVDQPPPRRWGFSIPHGLKPSAIPVHLVCGAPASGKTTFVKQKAARSDTIIDLDDYCVRVGGRLWDDDRSILRRAFAYRDAVLHSLSSRKRGTVWLIATAPTKAERDAWCEALKKVTVHLMPTTKEACIARLRADPARRHALDRHLRAVDKWFAVDRGAV